jgi:hypothetical protein
MKEVHVFTVYVAVTLLAAIANAFSATLDFVRYRQVLVNMARAGVSESWLTTLGVLKAAGALGLLVGFSVPLIGIAAAIGLVLFFVAAIITHLRARDYTFGLAVVFLLLAVATLSIGLYVRGSTAFMVGA